MAMRKILIVEDQALARTYLCSCVEKCTDCEVAGTLTRADAALCRCGEGHIDLILMDKIGRASCRERVSEAV